MNHKDIKLAIVGAGRAFLLAAAISLLRGDIEWGICMLLVSGAMFILWQFYKS